MQYTSGFSDADHFSTHVGVSGLLNADKLRLVHIVFNDLQRFHENLKQNGDCLRCNESPDACTLYADETFKNTFNRYDYHKPSSFQISDKEQNVDHTVGNDEGSKSLFEGTTATDVFLR